MAIHGAEQKRKCRVRSGLHLSRLEQNARDLFVLGECRVEAQCASHGADRLHVVLLAECGAAELEREAGIARVLFSQRFERSYAGLLGALQLVLGSGGDRWSHARGC